MSNSSLTQVNISDALSNLPEANIAIAWSLPFCQSDFFTASVFPTISIFHLECGFIDEYI